MPNGLRNRVTLRMAIDGVGKIGAPATSKVGSKTGTAKPGEFARMVDGDSEVSSASEVSEAQAVTSINPLFALQEVDGATERRAKAKQRGTKILDELDSIRHGLLMGEVTPHQLQTLRHQIANEQQILDDPRLTELLKEIDLRAEVELAKLEMAAKANED